MELCYWFAVQLADGIWHVWHTKVGSGGGHGRCGFSGVFLFPIVTYRFTPSYTSSVAGVAFFPASRACPSFEGEFIWHTVIPHPTHAPISLLFWPFHQCWHPWHILLVVSHLYQQGHHHTSIGVTYSGIPQALDQSQAREHLQQFWKVTNLQQIGQHQSGRPWGETRQLHDLQSLPWFACFLQRNWNASWKPFNSSQICNCLT